jgi:hypothetical protein
LRPAEVERAADRLTAALHDEFGRDPAAPLFITFIDV